MSKREVIEVKVESLNPFNEDIFHLYEGERLEEMVASVKESGVIHPVVVREVDGELQILSGHNRVNACMIAGLASVPCINRGIMSDDEARFIVTESNLMQRGFESLSLLEKASCISVRHKAMKHQGIRPEVVSEVVDLLDSDEHTGGKLGKSFNISPRQISRYVKIDGLTEEIKAFIDSGKIKFVAGTYVAGLTKEHQWLVAEILLELDEGIDEKEAKELYALEVGDYFTRDSVYAVLKREVDIVKSGFKMSGGFLGEFFEAGTSKDEIMDRIRKGLELLKGEGE